MNGSRTSAAMDRFDRLNTPTATFGSTTLKPAAMPWLSTVTLGGSEKPSPGISWRSLSTKPRTPSHSSGPRSTSISVFAPVVARK